jgi:hypothetical protein
LKRVRFHARAAQLVLKALQLAERLTSSPPPPPTGITAEQPTADSAR